MKDLDPSNSQQHEWRTQWSHRREMKNTVWYEESQSDPAPCGSGGARGGRRGVRVGSALCVRRTITCSDGEEGQRRVPSLPPPDPRNNEKNEWFPAEVRLFPCRCSAHCAVRGAAAAPPETGGIIGSPATKKWSGSRKTVRTNGTHSADFFVCISFQMTQQLFEL